MTTAHRNESTLSEVTLYNGDTFGLILGDLRKVVAAAAGMPDDAEVTIEETQRHYARLDTFLAKRITVVKHERLAAVLDADQSAKSGECRGCGATYPMDALGMVEPHQYRSPPGNELECLGSKLTPLRVVDHG